MASIVGFHGPLTRDRILWQLVELSILRGRNSDWHPLLFIFLINKLQLYVDRFEQLCREGQHRRSPHQFKSFSYQLQLL